MNQQMRRTSYIYRPHPRPDLPPNPSLPFPPLLKKHKKKNVRKGLSIISSPHHFIGSRTKRNERTWPSCRDRIRTSVRQSTPHSYLFRPSHTYNSTAFHRSIDRSTPPPVAMRGGFAGRWTGFVSFRFVRLGRNGTGWAFLFVFLII